MIATLERTGDRLLSLVVPRTIAVAHHCWYENRNVGCSGGGFRICRYHCCSPGGCTLVSCSACLDV